MKAGQKMAAALLALSLLSMLLLPGCTSNKYVPCCVRGSIYQEGGDAFSNPRCVFQNGSLYGPCLLPSDTKSVAFCSNGATTCASLKDPESCTATYDCSWSNNACTGGTGGQAYVLFPICTDLVPKSCVNNKCTAMMCGYADIRPAPPPASQDWNASKSADAFAHDPNALPSNLPGSDLQTPSIGLQGMTCDFNTMNNKLYNKVKASRGALWVNSFRFGVGSSFSDFDAAKNFFPATDHLCAANPNAQVDRFTVYLGSAATFCKASTSYYQCVGPKGSGLYFKGDSKGEEQCRLYCGGGSPPYSCTMVPGGAEKYICNQDGFAYDTESSCRLKCSVIDDPNACANDVSKFPFLSSNPINPADASYRMKYVSDYMVDSRDPSYGLHHAQTCTETAGPDSRYPFYGWIEKTIAEPDHCNDYYGDPAYGWSDGPWFGTYDCHYATGCNLDNTCDAKCPGGNKMGQQRTYFDNHAYSALDFDYDYYREALFQLYPPSAQTTRLEFECKSSSDCLSGSCDTTHYKRSICEGTLQHDVPGDAGVAGPDVACLCSKKQFGSSYAYYPACQLSDAAGNSLAMYADTNIPAENVANPIASDVKSGGAMFYPDDSLHANHNPSGSSLHFKYYVPAPAPDSPKPLFFERCGVQPAQRVQKCIRKDKYVESICDNDGGSCKYYARFTDENVIWDPDSDGKCYYSGTNDPNWPGGSTMPDAGHYWYYNIYLGEEDAAKAVNLEAFGSCALNGNLANQQAPTPPYLKMSDLGWCAGCTYATLAVQKVDWGLPLPGGENAPRKYSCYEYRGEFNYIPSKTDGPYGGGVDIPPGAAWSNPLYDGQIRYSSLAASPSTQPVRYNSNPSAYESDTDGNIRLSWGKDGASPSYVCEDGWHASGGWWSPGEIPTPSAPYLKEKLTSLLQSNIMPILDEVDEKTAAISRICESVASKCASTDESYATPAICDANCDISCQPISPGGGYACPLDRTILESPQTPDSQAACTEKCNQVRVINDGYNPLSICNVYGGDGGVIHAIGNTSMLAGGTAADYGSIMPSDLGSDALEYMGIAGTAPAVFAGNAAGGKNAIIARTALLKGKCKTPPLAGIEVLPGENEASLIGTGDLLVPANPSRGKLHKFFFKDATGYEQRVARGMPDKIPDNVDLLLQDWYPLCNSQGTSVPGEREAYEFDKRMDLSRALLANFSKPSLVWKFAFPKNSLCDQTLFLDYLFNHTQEMVDSGITGLIYSDWSTKDGLGYGPSSRHYEDTATYPGETNPPSWRTIPSVSHSWSGELKTGLSQELPTVRGTASDETYVLDDKIRGTGKTDLFCALEKYSLRSIGYMGLTYGQKLYAENQTCYCTQCTAYDIMMGACVVPSDANNNADLAQLYCNDGTKCTMPGLQANYNRYKCEPRCMNYTACKLCDSVSNIGAASFCRFTDPGGQTSGYSKPYTAISDDYWEFLTGLSPSEKCCLAGKAEAAGTKYTYVGMSGTKQQSVFLQYPTRGELDLDCGSAPDTSVLQYCNIKVPISQKEIACMRIANPTVPIVINPQE